MAISNAATPQYRSAQRFIDVTPASWSQITSAAASGYNLATILKASSVTDSAKSMSAAV
jgi:hypothetical protein